MKFFLRQFFSKRGCIKKKNQGENYGTSTGFAQKNKEDQENKKIKIKMELFLFQNKIANRIEI